MSFGLTNAQTTSYNMMNVVLYDFLYNFDVVYLEDIVLFSINMEDHVVYLSRMLGRLREHELYINDKYEFVCVEIIFLGMGQVRMDLKKR